MGRDEANEQKEQAGFKDQCGNVICAADEQTDPK